MKKLNRTCDDLCGSVALAFMTFCLAFGWSEGSNQIVFLLLLLSCGLLSAKAVHKFITPVISTDGKSVTLYGLFRSPTLALGDISHVSYRKKAGLHYGYFIIHLGSNKHIGIHSGTKLKHHRDLCSFFEALQIPALDFKHEEEMANKKVHFTTKMLTHFRGK